MKMFTTARKGICCGATTGGGGAGAYIFFVVFTAVGVASLLIYYHCFVKPSRAVEAAQEGVTQNEV